MTTIRIYVEHGGPLDGASPLHPESTSAWNAQLGLREIWVPEGVPLGRLHLGTLAPGSEHWIEHLTVLSACGAHDRGAFVGLAGPELAEVTLESTPTIPLVDLGACEETDTGVLTEGLSTPIPTDHALVIDTRANGSSPGPHLIQLTLGPVPRVLQGSLPTLRPMLTVDEPVPAHPAQSEPGKKSDDDDAPDNPLQQEATKERIASFLSTPVSRAPDDNEESDS